jgi:hypothetical protein
MVLEIAKNQRRNFRLMTKKKEENNQNLKTKPMRFDVIHHHNDSGNSSSEHRKTLAPPNYISYKGPLKGGRHEPYPLTPDEIDDHVSLLAEIGQSEDPDAFIGHEKFEMGYDTVWESIKYKSLETPTLINFYKGYFLCQPIFKWLGGSIAFHQHIFVYITEHLPASEFSEEDREELWNWALLKMRDKVYRNPWSPSNQSKYGGCRNYQDKLAQDQKAQLNLKHDEIRHQAALERKALMQELNRLKQERKRVNEEAYNIHIELFKQKPQQEKINLIKKNQLPFPMNLLPKNEIEAFIADHNMTKGEKAQFYEFIPKKTNEFLKRYKKLLGFELSQERNIGPLH